jgi:hypothetical protein
MQIMGYLYNNLSIFLHLKQIGEIGINCRMLDLGSQDFMVSSESEFQILKQDMESFTGNEIRINRDEFTGVVPAGRVFGALGIDYHCVDIDGRNDSIYLDLNFREIKQNLLNQFDIVCNQGTTEHLVNQGNCYANIHDMLKIGGIFYSNVQFLGLQNHGQINLTLRFWDNLLLSNVYTPIFKQIAPPCALPSHELVPEGMKDVQYIDMMPPESANFHIILKKNVDAPFIFPIDGMSASVDSSWYQQLITSSLISSYVRPGLMDLAEVQGHVNRAMQRLFPSVDLTAFGREFDVIPCLAPLPTTAEHANVAEGEREISAGMLAAGTVYRLLVKGRVGAREIDRLIRKLELDKEILAD